MLALGLTLVAAGSAGAETVRITFEGSCDFIYQTTPAGTLVTVVMPAWEEMYGGPTDAKPLKIPKHEPFIAFGEAVAVMLPTSSTITIDNVSPGVVDTTRFDDAVYRMDGSPSPDRIAKGVSLKLPAGTLRAVGGYERWVVLGSNEKIPDDPKPKALASSAVFEYQTTSNNPLVLRTSKGGEFRVPFRNGVAAVVIASLPPDDIFFNGTYDPKCTDDHYVLHYKLKATESVAGVKIPRWLRRGCDGVTATMDPVPLAIPTGAPPVQPPAGMSTGHADGVTYRYGAREDCFMARWN
jgi:hypothetical protein